MVEEPGRFYEFGPFRLDTAKRVLLRGAEPIPLPPKALEILVALVRGRGELIEKEQLLKEVWRGSFVEEANIAVNVSLLRKTLGEASNGRPYIETVPKRGYRFVMPQPPAASAASRSRRRVWIAAAGLAALAVCLSVLLPRVLRRDAQSIRSLAVLPLQNLSGDPAQEYLADGFTEALVTDLAQVRSLRVISRTSSMRYKGTRASLPEIARQLNVDGVVEGSVARSNDRIRITVQLIQASTDRHLWADTYDGGPNDVLALQSMVARAVIQEIRAALTPEERQRLARVRSIDPEANEDYLRSRYLWNQRTPESAQKSVVYLERAVAKDPRYASGYLALAEAYAVLVSNDIASPEEAVPKAKRAASEALRLDPGLGEADATLAHLEFFYDWSFRSAEEHFRRALELSPGSATAHQWYGLLLLAEKRFDEAARQFGAALEIDPLSLTTSADLGQVYFYSGRYDQAIAQTVKVLEMNPQFSMGHDLKGMAYEQKGMYAEALTEFQQYAQLSQDSLDSRMHLAHLYAVTGRPADAGKLLDELEHPPHGQFVSSYDLASIYAGLGNKDQALQWLERAYDERAPMIPLMGIDPLLDPVRSDPRYQALLRRLQLQ
jgi:TolB-like protein/DNA-binding winged helix-turn-helix (wHTH) protein/Tfp pilus assembly protein PilF